jgi:hypothetical protein
MMRTINYSPDKMVNAQGCNGYMKCAGLSILFMRAGLSTTDLVELSPLTSKGLIGNCAIQIPIDHLPELIQTLTQLLHVQHDHVI